MADLIFSYFGPPCRRPENPVNSELAHYFFLVFWIKLMDQNTKKMTKPVFFGKSTVGPNLGKKDQKWSFSTFSQNQINTFGLKQAKMLHIMVRMYGTPYVLENSCLPCFGENN